MGLMQNLKIFLGFEDEGEVSNSEFNMTGFESPVQETETRSNQTIRVPKTENQNQPRAKKAALIDFQAMQKRPIKTSADISAFATELILTEPKSHEDSILLSGYLKEGKPVVVNLKYLDAAAGKRLIDFVCGTVYAFEGHMQKLGSNIFLFTPKNIGIVSKQHDDFEFNQTEPETAQSSYSMDNAAQAEMFYQTA